MTTMSRHVGASKKPVWIALAVALVIQTGLISVQARRRIDTSFVRVWILDTLVPIEKLVDRSLHSVFLVWNRYVALVGLYDENQRLKREADLLRMQNEKEEEDV